MCCNWSRQRKSVTCGAQSNKTIHQYSQLQSKHLAFQWSKGLWKNARNWTPIPLQETQVSHDNWHSTARTLWCAWAQGRKGQRAPSTLQHSILFVHCMPMYMYCIFTYELMHIHISHSMLMMFMIWELWYRAWIHFWESPMRPCSLAPQC